MNITYLAFNRTSRQRLLKEELPDGVYREEKGIFKVGDHESFLIEFGTSGTSVANAKVLGDMRDNLPSAKGVHVLKDEASQYFAKRLFPKLAKYERELRQVLFLALDLGQYDVKDGKGILNSIAKESISNLGNKLFFDKWYMEKVREQVSQDKPFSKRELVEFVSTAKEDTPWDVLFRDCGMDYVKESFWPIVRYRNIVMHHRTIKSVEYDDALHRLQKSTSALVRYSQNVCDGTGDMVDRERRAVRASRAILEGIEMNQISEAFSSLTEIVAQNNEGISKIMSEYSERYSDTLSKYNDIIATNVSGLAESVAKAMADQNANISKAAIQALAATTAMDQIQKSVYQATIKALRNTAIPSFQTTLCDLEKPLPHPSNEGIDKTKADEVSQDDEENNLL